MCQSGEVFGETVQFVTWLSVGTACPNVAGCHGQMSHDEHGTPFGEGLVGSALSNVRATMRIGVSGHAKPKPLWVVWLVRDGLLVVGQG